MERKLAAILAADVVGYSRLMEQDEAKAFERLQAHRIEFVAGDRGAPRRNLQANQLVAGAMSRAGNSADATIRAAWRASICSTNFNSIPLAGGLLVTASPTIARATDCPRLDLF
jgi:hypothetical protein